MGIGACRKSDADSPLPSLIPSLQALNKWVSYPRPATASDSGVLMTFSKSLTLL